MTTPHSKDGTDRQDIRDIGAIHGHTPNPIAVLGAWYRLDENAVPPRLKRENSKVVVDASPEDTRKFRDSVETRLRVI